MPDTDLEPDPRNVKEKDTNGEFLVPPPPPSPSIGNRILRNSTRSILRTSSRGSESNSSITSSIYDDGEGHPSLDYGSDSTTPSRDDNFSLGLRPFLTVKEGSVGLSTNGVMLQPRPMYYFTYPEQATHFSHQPLNFYIEGPCNEEGMIWPDCKHFAVKVRNPSGKSCAVTVKLDKSKPLRYICSFEPLNWGTYTGSVRVGAHRQHISRSPFEFLVVSSALSTPSTTVSPFECVPSIPFTTRVIPDVVARVPPGPVKIDADERESAPAWGIAVDSSSFPRKIFVADKVGNRIRTLTPDGKAIEDFVSQDRLKGPVGLAVDSTNKRILVANFLNDRICIYSLNTGDFVYSFGKTGTCDGEFSGPWGLAVSPDGNRIAVADTFNHRIQLFDKRCRFLRKFSVIENDPFRFRDVFYRPRGICFDNNGKYIYVTDLNLGLVSRFNLDLTERDVIIAKGQLNRPQGITMDGTGRLLISESANRCIQVVSADGTPIHAITIGQDHQNFESQGIVSLATDRLAFLDRSGAVVLCKF